MAGLNCQGQDYKRGINNNVAAGPSNPCTRNINLCMVSSREYGAITVALLLLIRSRLFSSPLLSHGYFLRLKVCFRSPQNQCRSVVS